MFVDQMTTMTDSATMAPAMITGVQIRAARALLGWSADTLAKQAGLSYPTVQRAETVDGVPNMRTGNMMALQSALQSAGVIFLDPGDTRDGGPGVRLRALDSPADPDYRIRR
jgi:DNA-binding XRE family transcriptional regulator